MQVERCTREIAQLDAEINRRLQQVDLAPRGDAGDDGAGEGDDGFAYSY
jgi:hypothetical protein